MKRRCLNPNSQHYPSYGGRGIKVCERWKLFENFLADMGVCPPGKTLGRIANGKGYYPLNCRWETRREQSTNTRQTRFLFHDGLMETVAECAKRLGLSKSAIKQRMRYGWPYSQPLARQAKARPVNRSKKSVFPGVYKDRNWWRARLTFEGKRKNAGIASTPLAAYLLRVKAAQERGITLPEGDYFIPEITGAVE
jgi:hypothetical protein